MKCLFFIYCHLKWPLQTLWKISHHSSTLTVRMGSVATGAGCEASLLAARGQRHHLTFQIPVAKFSFDSLCKFHSRWFVSRPPLLAGSLSQSLKALSLWQQIRGVFWKTAIVQSAPHRSTLLRRQVSFSFSSYSFSVWVIRFSRCILSRRWEFVCSLCPRSLAFTQPELWWLDHHPGTVQCELKTARTGFTNNTHWHLCFMKRERIVSFSLLSLACLVIGKHPHYEADGQDGWEEGK